MPPALAAGVGGALAQLLARDPAARVVEPPEPEVGRAVESSTADRGGGSGGGNLDQLLQQASAALPGGNGGGHMRELLQIASALLPPPSDTPLDELLGAVPVDPPLVQEQQAAGPRARVAQWLSGIAAAPSAEASVDADEVKLAEDLRHRFCGTERSVGVSLEGALKDGAVRDSAQRLLRALLRGTNAQAPPREENLAALLEAEADEAKQAFGAGALLALAHDANAATGGEVQARSMLDQLLGNGARPSTAPHGQIEADDGISAAEGSYVDQLMAKVAKELPPPLHTQHDGGYVQQLLGSTATSASTQAPSAVAQLFGADPEDGRLVQRAESVLERPGGEALREALGMLPVPALTGFPRPTELEWGAFAEHVPRSSRQLRELLCPEPSALSRLLRGNATDTSLASVLREYPPCADSALLHAQRDIAEHNDSTVGRHVAQSTAPFMGRVLHVVSLEADTVSKDVHVHDGDWVQLRMPADAAVGIYWRVEGVECTSPGVNAEAGTLIVRQTEQHAASALHRHEELFIVAEDCAAHGPEGLGVSLQLALRCLGRNDDDCTRMSRLAAVTLRVHVTPAVPTSPTRGVKWKPAVAEHRRYSPSDLLEEARSALGLEEEEAQHAATAAKAPKNSAGSRDSDVPRTTAPVQMMPVPVDERGEECADDRRPADLNAQLQEALAQVAAETAKRCALEKELAAAKQTMKAATASGTDAREPGQSFDLELSAFESDGSESIPAPSASAIRHELAAALGISASRLIVEQMTPSV